MTVIERHEKDALLFQVSLGVATAIGAPQPDPLLYTNPGLSYLSPVPYNQQFYRVGVRDNCLPNTYEDNTGKNNFLASPPKKSSEGERIYHDQIDDLIL